MGRIIYSDGRIALTTTAFRYKLTDATGTLVKDWTTGATWTEEPAGTYYLDDEDAVPGTYYAVEPATGEVGATGMVPADVQVTVPEPVFAGTVTFSGTVEAPAVTVNPTLTPEESAKLMGAAQAGEAAAAAQTVIDALPVAESIPASWVTITEATLDDDGDALGVASVGGSTAAALGMRIEAITAGALMNATTVGNTLGTYALPVEPGHTYTLRFALPGAAMTERTVTVA